MPMTMPMTVWHAHRVRHIGALYGPNDSADDGAGRASHGSANDGAGA